MAGRTRLLQLTAHSVEQSRSRIRGKPDKAHSSAYRCGQLADVELAGSPHLSRSSVTDVELCSHTTIFARPSW